MRVLGRVRLSRVTEESTSVERQRNVIETWANANGHEVVGWAEDLDVSGSVDVLDPKTKTQFGHWMTERMHEFDVIACWKLDRLSRSTINLNKLIAECLKYEKGMVSCSEGIDISTPVGRLICNVIGFLAEGELAAIKERQKASQKKLRETGRWGGGKVFYGYRAEQLDGGGFELVVDEHSSEVVSEVVKKVLAGQSTESIARELNERGELAPADYQRQRAGKPLKGSKWSNAHLRQQLRSKAMLGHATHKGNTVRDELGRPVLKGPPLINQSEFDRLQTALESRSFKVSTRSVGASPLLGVAHCGIKIHKEGCEYRGNPYSGPVCDCEVCGKPMHIRQHRRSGKLYRYYQCVGGADGHAKTHAEANIIKADELEESCETTFLGVHGPESVKERVLIPAESHQVELDEAKRAVEEIAPLLGTATSETVRTLYRSQLEALDLRIAELEKLPESVARWEWLERTETYADVWEESDAEQRRQLLIKRKIRAEVAVPRGTGRYRSGAEAMVHMFTLDVDPALDEVRHRAWDRAAAEKEPWTGHHWATWPPPEPVDE